MQAARTVTKALGIVKLEIVVRLIEKTDIDAR
jgi:hypothetical protein